MAAAAVAHLAGARLEEIGAAVASFPGVEHRIEFVRELNGVEYYNDSKATNVDAALKAIDAFPGGLWIILGGKDKGSDYAPLRAPLAERAKGVLLIGAAPTRRLIRKALDGAVAFVRLWNARACRNPCARARRLGRHRPARPRLRQFRSIRKLRAAR